MSSKKKEYRIAMSNQDPAQAGSLPDRQMDITYTIPTSNSFTGLPLVTDTTTTASSPKAQTVPAGTYRAPIIIKPSSYVIDKSQFTKLANIKAIAGKYNFQRLVDGDIKLIPPNVETGELLKKSMSDHDIDFNTHSNVKLSKYVLYGLSSMEPTTILKEIRKATQGKLIPTAVSRMTIKTPKYDDHCNYIVYFETNPTLPVLMNVAHVLFDYNVVTWRPYHNKHEGPVQCSNCQRWKHGAFGCHRKPRCRVCGQEHKTPTCPLLIAKRNSNNEKLHPSLLKCANCGGNHTANYNECTHKPSHTPRPSRAAPANHQEQPRVNDQEQFPQIYRHKNHRNSNINNNQFFNDNNNSWANQFKSQPNNQNDLFTLEEMQLVLSDIFANLRLCTSREEQFQLMFKLSAKYVYGR